ncbi:DUF3536 domain-containing protein [candidate division KSB1 bacterium]|nr:DUF3536 domain-containing protein [candidate division KSB1 bacterium]
MTGSTNHLIIHGHFYQPPRENPWIDAIELQESAKPFHDWNERITEESYRPNANSRILGQGNRIIDIVNNYQYISFNFGPTLLHWIRRNAPDVYSAIIEADKQSLIHFSGHGNAIAQAYNHMILPLANKRDKVTQILWGLEDFKYHFDREAESIWLPETAIDHETLETLIDMRIKYIILSPHQALRVRRLQGHSKWADVSLGTIDTNQAYRCFAMDENGRKSHDRYIDILFYHADLSRGVAFDHLLKNAGRFADSIQHVFDGSRQRDRLVTICTDGETFGHHEPFGDMALAYLLHKEAVSRDFKLTNFGEFLEKHPPHHEVELKPGPNGEGTSWSCFHGVGRWYRDCGCSTGAMGNWNQKWRWNLRKSLDYLRDRLALIFSNAGGHYFLDPWAARDDYIHVITNRSPESMERFWGRNCNRNLSAAEKTICLQLLEMQLHAMLMYTSCAWFFADISGIETVQIMKYAARAIDYAYGFSNEMLEENFLEILKDAHSNLAQMGTGRDIYRRYVSPARFSFHRMANLYAINSFFQKDSEPPESVIYQYEITSRDQQRISTPRGDLCIGSVEIFHRTTHEKRAYAFLSRKLNDICFDTFVRWLEHADFDYESAKRSVIAHMNDEDFVIQLPELWGG